LSLSFLAGVIASPWDIIRSLIDIGIVAYVLYRVLGLIRGTRAEQLLKGLVLLLVFTVIASYLKLDMVNWLVEKLWILFAITIPIVFQPEIRRFLEQLGRGSFFASRRFLSKMEDYENIITEVSAAAKVLSRNRVGALIVLTRQTGIGEYLESGVKMDSLVSSALLINLFVPNTPLHDGAMVINEGRIDRAACFLPLSDNPNIDQQLGTRHRAGLGISEVSDALVLIVSEETGIISLAQEGRLQRGLDGDSLKEILTRELLKDERPGDNLLRRWSGGSQEPEKEHNRA
jgi:diadenylate cyclase